MSKFNSEDVKDHNSVVGIIRNHNNKNEILMMDHVKAGKWMPPVGKADAGESLSKAFDREIFEELGITNIKKYFLYQSEPYKFKREGKDIYISFIVYEVENYDGQIINKEPHKHKALKYMNLKYLSTVAKGNAALECIFKALEVENKYY